MTTRMTSVSAVLLTVLGLTACAVSPESVEQTARPVRGLIAGAFNQHDHATIVRAQGERALRNAWAADGDMEIAYLSIDLAQRNSLSNIQRQGPFAARVATSPDEALSDGAGPRQSTPRFLLAFAYPANAPLPAPLPGVMTLEVGDAVGDPSGPGPSVFEATLHSPAPRED